MVYRYVEWNESDLYNLVSIRRRFGGLFLRGDLLGENINVKKLKSIHAHDFLISKRQVSHGAWAVVPVAFHNAKVSDEYDCLQIKEKDKLISCYWLWYCQLPILRHYAYLDSNGVHIEKLIFDFDQFKKRKVLIPYSIIEQTAIAQVLQAANTEIQLLKAKMEKLKEQKKGLMQVLLTGRVRLKVN
jgi:type I restriction enzyme S subunit